MFLFGNKRFFYELSLYTFSHLFHHTPSMGISDSIQLLSLENEYGG